jgi:hypothetical protein
MVANVGDLRSISHRDRKSDHADAQKLARFARLDPKILRSDTRRTVEKQEALTLIRARDLMASASDRPGDIDSAKSWTS